MKVGLEGRILSFTILRSRLELPAGVVTLVMVRERLPALENMAIREQSLHIVFVITSWVTFVN